jgi:hypothetical protein
MPGWRYNAASISPSSGKMGWLGNSTRQAVSGPDSTQPVESFGERDSRANREADAVL